MPRPSRVYLQSCWIFAVGTAKRAWFAALLLIDDLPAVSEAIAGSRVEPVFVLVSGRSQLVIALSVIFWAAAYTYHDLRREHLALVAATDFDQAVGQHRAALARLAREIQAVRSGLADYMGDQSNYYRPDILDGLTARLERADQAFRSYLNRHFDDSALVLYSREGSPPDVGHLVIEFSFGVRLLQRAIILDQRASEVIERVTKGELLPLSASRLAHRV